MEILFKIVDREHVYGYYVKEGGINRYIPSDRVVEARKGLKEVPLEDFLKGKFEIKAEKNYISMGSSKGNQTKWYSNGMWYKHDYLGYEGKAEWVVSEVLKCSTLNPEEYIEYIEMDIEGKPGCQSKNFLNENDILVTFHRLFKQNLYDYERDLINLEGTDVKIDRLIYKVNEFTGLNITNYLKKIFTLDAFIFNEDRHMNNLALIYNRNTDEYTEAPIFDNGLSLLSDVGEYPDWDSIIPHLKRVVPKPFGGFFEEPIKHLGVGVRFHEDKLNMFLNTHRCKLGRVYDILKYSMKIYDYLLL